MGTVGWGRWDGDGGMRTAGWGRRDEDGGMGTAGWGRRDEDGGIGAAGWGRRGRGAARPGRQEAPGQRGVRRQSRRAQAAVAMRVAIQTPWRGDGAFPKGHPGHPQWCEALTPAYASSNSRIVVRILPSGRVATSK